MILDPSLLIGVLRGGPGPQPLLDDLEPHAIGVTAVSVMEPWEAIQVVSDRADGREQVESLLDGIPTLPFDHVSANRAGWILAELAANGTPIDVDDVMIASLARTADVTVVTANHFDRIRGLEVVAYRTSPACSRRS